MSLDPDVYGTALDMLLSLESIDELIVEHGRWEDEVSLSSTMTRTIDGLREALQLGGNSVILNWVRRASRNVRAELGGRPWSTSLEQKKATEILAESAALDEMANGQLDLYTLSQDREQILNQARQDASEIASEKERALESGGALRALTGDAGEAKLSEHFESYAEAERKAARNFRIAAISGVSVALVFALVIGPIPTGDWAHLTWRIAVVAGAGTLAAYFARQAAQHRRIYNWARSLEVQLLSFPAFIQPLGDEERAEAYRALARRILSSPPEKGADTSDDTAGAAQLLELAAIIAKRT